jgi:hypothetical protein
MQAVVDHDAESAVILSRTPIGAASTLGLMWVARDADPVSMPGTRLDLRSVASDRGSDVELGHAGPADPQDM